MRLCVWTVAFSDPLIWEEKNKDAAIYIHRIATNKKHRGHHYVKNIVTWALVPLKKQLQIHSFRHCRRQHRVDKSL